MIENPEVPEAEEETPVILKITKEQARNKIDAMIAEWWCNYDEKVFIMIWINYLGN